MGGQGKGDQFILQRHASHFEGLPLRSTVHSRDDDDDDDDDEDDHGEEQEEEERQIEVLKKSLSVSAEN